MAFAFLDNSYNPAPFQEKGAGYNLLVVQTAKILYTNLPETPGVYLMKGARGKVLYIGKAGNLRRRVSSYYLRSHDSKIEKLLSEIRKIDYRKTETAIEALILESQLIKKYGPPYNAKEKDDKSFLYVEATKERFPRILLVRGSHIAKATRDKKNTAVGQPYYGPFTSATSIREALKIIRKIFPYNIHPPIRDPKLSRLNRGLSTKSERIHTNPQKKKSSKKGFVDSDKFADSNRGSHRRPCFDYELGLCPGTCIGAISRTEYLKNIRNIKLFLNGKKKQLLNKLEKEMKAESKKLEFEKAEKLRRQIFAIKHIRDVALLSEENFQFPISNFQKRASAKRIEGYDISNISGTSAVGAMVVFTNGKPNKNEYRKFRISTISKSDDVGMIKEMLRRRLNNPWPYPALILIDGGKGQVNAAESVLNELGLRLPVVGIAKGLGRKKNEFVGYKPSQEEKKILIKVREEAHRFAISYHRKLRSAKALRG